MLCKRKQSVKKPYSAENVLQTIRLVIGIKDEEHLMKRVKILTEYAAVFL